MRAHANIMLTVSLLVVQCFLGVSICLGAKPTRASLEKAIKRAPGNVELRCELVGMLLAEGDTTEAEQQLDYALKLGQGGCLHIHRARIALNRGKQNDAAGSCSAAVNAGLLPDDEPFIHEVDSVTAQRVTTRLKMLCQKDKSNTYIPTGLGQLYLHKQDTVNALVYMREAYRRGDTTQLVLIDSLAAKQSVVPHKPDSVSADSAAENANIRTIPFTRTFGKIEVSCTLNGLKIKAEVDTVAKESTISGVETTFMVKNNYVTNENIVNDNTLIIREISFGEGLVLRGIRLHHRRTQESPVILCLDDLRQLGNVRINEEKKVIEIRE